MFTRDDPVHNRNVFTTPSIAKMSNLSVDDRLVLRATFTQPWTDTFVCSVELYYFDTSFTFHVYHKSILQARGIDLVAIVHNIESYDSLHISHT